MSFDTRRLRVVALAIVLVGALPLGMSAAASDVANSQSTRSHEVGRRFGARATGAAAERATGRVVVGVRSAAAASDVSRVLAQQGLTMKERARDAGTRIVEVETGRERETARRLAQLPGVTYAEPDYIVRATASLTPTDPLYSSDQWNLARINMPDAWARSVGESTVRVAVLDSGFTFTHPDLSTQWAFAPGRALNEHVFLTTPLLSSGCSVPSAPSDDDGHGTHIAGTLGSASTLSGASPIGVAGIAPGARMMPLKVLDCHGNGYLSDVGTAIDFATQVGAPIITMSLASEPLPECPPYLQEPINRAVAAGVFVIAAVGNNGDTTVRYPAGCSGVVGVGATTITDGLATFSNRNPSVFVSAPGVGIMSAWKDGGYAIADGTSMATPHVAGCAALLKSFSPSLEGPAIRSIIQTTAVDLGASGYDTSFGWGRLDCGAALASIAGSQLTPTSMPTQNTPTAPTAGRSFAVTSQASTVGLSWLSGVGQTGFNVVRLAGGTVTILPAGGLPATAIGYTDTTAPAGLDCYTLYVLGTTPQGQSDLECAVVGFGSIVGSPQAFTLRLNQSGTATLSWAQPSGGGQDGYLLVAIGGLAQSLPASATSASVPINGLTCFALGAVRNGALMGYSDLLCGLPGFSNLSPGPAAGTAAGLGAGVSGLSKR